MASVNPHIGVYSLRQAGKADSQRHAGLDLEGEAPDDMRLGAI